MITSDMVLYLTDAPTDIKITTPNGDGTVHLWPGFVKHVFQASAKSYTAIECSSVAIIWMSSIEGKLKSCSIAGKIISKC